MATKTAKKKNPELVLEPKDRKVPPKKTPCVEAVDCECERDRNLPTVKIQLLEDGILPVKAHETDAAFDCFANEDAQIACEDRKLIKLGFKMQLPAYYEAQIRPRSGLALNSGISIVNTPGTVDCGYTGEVGVILINHGETPFEVKKGDRVCQMVIAKLPVISIEEVTELEKTDRGNGGFGSTGLN